MVRLSISCFQSHAASVKTQSFGLIQTRGTAASALHLFGRETSIQRRPIETSVKFYLASLLASGSLFLCPTLCSASEVPLKEPPQVNNPLWPSGISESDVDELVTDILNDPTINITGIPDYIERQIYRSTIVLTLNTVYQTLGEMHGSDILGHQLEVTRQRKVLDGEAKERLLKLMREDVDDEILEQLADRLLANRSINQPLVPDIIEKELYVNCLKLVFRILHMLASSFQMTICGHEFKLIIEKSVRKSIQKELLQRAASSLTEIDTDVLKELAQEMGVNSDEVSKMTYMERIMSSSQQQLVAPLHACLYGLILGIMDDFLANTELVLLSDRILFDIVCPEKPPAKAISSQIETKRKGFDKPVESPLRLLQYFTCGVGVGAAIVSMLVSKRP